MITIRKTTEVSMTPEQSPFHNQSHYAVPDHAADGSFHWLREAPSHRKWAIGDTRAEELPSQLTSLTASAKRNGFTLPAEFVTFISNPELHKRIRSTSGDYLDLSESALPFEDGYLIHFLSDQQCCVHWFLYVNGDGLDHCVVVTHAFFGAAEENDEPRIKDFGFRASSFEAFMTEYWIGHERGFAFFDNTNLPEFVGQHIKKYVDD